ncbi:hypothetical protein [Methylocaldum sp.]|uniref:hypothetical protein n=1 Tax=Methylocaldum sp. TaxID=1969727 RepID=UPI002D39345B|nr:hypothetical protein [Methylocaldum sp.]HYE38176.1 hypothetical protein [Methylocaldum sp.]
MKASHILSLMQNDYTTVQVAYSEGGKLYTFKALKSDNLAKDDFVVIPTSYNDWGYTLGKVISVDEEADIDTSVAYTYKWIVGKVDLVRYAGILEVEKRFERHILNMQKANTRRQLVQSVLESFPEGSKERADFELLLNSGQSLEQIERMLNNGTNLNNDSNDDAPGAGTGGSGA